MTYSVMKKKLNNLEVINGYQVEAVIDYPGGITFHLIGKKGEYIVAESDSDFKLTRISREKTKEEINDVKRIMSIIKNEYDYHIR